MTILNEIAEYTKKRYIEQEKVVPFEEIKSKARKMDSNTGFPFEKALAKEGLSYICEVKKASPSKGVIAEKFPYKEIAKDYEKAGASAISCLTEPKYFKGKNEYLKEISKEVSIPILRKDFTVCAYQIYEAKVIGASAILLICAILTEEEIKEYLNIATSLGLSALVEAHTEEEVKMAIHPDDPPWGIFGLPRIITCEENLDKFLKLVDDKHNGITLCAGSLGCSNQNDVAKMAAKYAAMGRIHFVHMRNVQVLDNGFEERAHLSSCGSLDMYAIMKALYDNGFRGYIRPDHGRMIWGETGRAGYGLYDRALGATYLNGLWEAIEKASK